MKTIHDGHRERVRERVNSVGLDGLNDHELLEYLLFFAIPRKDVNELAHRLINEFGSFSAVLDAEQSQLQKVDGITKNAAQFLKCLPDLFIRYQLEKRTLFSRINTLKDVCDYCYARVANDTNEKLLVVCLSVKRQLLHCFEFSSELSNTVRYTPADIATKILKTGARYAITAHNHPSGELAPSCSDYFFALDMEKRLTALDIKYLDNIIVSPIGALSFSGAYENRVTTGYYEAASIDPLSPAYIMGKEAKFTNNDQNN